MKTLALCFIVLVGTVIAHPLCLTGLTPSLASPPLHFCPQYTNSGCCDLARESEIVNNWINANLTLFSANFNREDSSTWTSCDSKLLQLACLHCAPTEFHLFEEFEGSPLVNRDYCVTQLATACGANTIPCLDSFDSTSVWAFPNPVPTIPVSTRGLVPAFGNLKVSNPISLRKAPNDHVSLYVATKDGLIFRIDPPNGNNEDPWVSQTNPYLLDIRSVVFPGGELGLLDFIFDPDYGTTNCYIFAFYTGLDKNNRLSRFHVEGCMTPNRNDDHVVTPSASECNMIYVVKKNYWHNGGRFLFDSQKRLYFGFGDGGEQNDIGTSDAQNPFTVKGKMIRIIPGRPADPYATNRCTGDNNYTIPTDNYYGTNASLGFTEIFAVGFRNPWDCEIVQPGDRIYCGDVGQVSYEEITRVIRAKNHGWNYFEGDGVFSNQGIEAQALVDSGLYQPPLLDYRHKPNNALHPRTVPNIMGTSISYSGVYNGTILPPKFRSGKWHIAADYYEFQVNAFFVDEETDQVFGETLVYDTPPIIRGGVDHEGEMIFISFNYAAEMPFYKFAPFSVPICGNYKCEKGESCTSCPIDCAGKLTGPNSQKYCCSNGDCIQGTCPVPCDGRPKPNQPVIGDGYCGFDENCNNSPLDCPGRKATDAEWCCIGFVEGPQCASPFDPYSPNLTFNSDTCKIVSNSTGNDPCKKGNKQGTGNGLWAL